MNEYFRQPIVSLSFILRLFKIIFTSPPLQVDTFDINICTAKTQRHVIDFQVPSQNSFLRFSTFSSQTAHETDLHRIEIPLEFHMLSSGRNKSTTSFWLSSFSIVVIVITYNLNYRNSSRPCLLVWCGLHRYVCSSSSLKWIHVSIMTSSGTNNTVWLSTAPTQPLTHWYQVKLKEAA